jgi:peptidoglycan/xylan/chitin deacetylase (PgdA/CDA1 family)
MRYLKSAGYNPIRLSDFIAFLQHRRQLPQKSVLITFDDVRRDFLDTAYPVLRELGLPAVVFVATAAVASRPGGPGLTWTELQDLARNGIDTQAQSRTRDLRRGAAESVAAYSRRMQQELEPPVELLRRHLPRLPDGLETLAYSGGGWSDDATRFARQYGYGAAFGLSGEPNPAFAGIFQISRTPMPIDAALEDFKRALVTFYELSIGPGRAEVGPHWSQPIRSDASRRDVAAPHREWSATLEQRGLLREARDECLMAAAIDPEDAPAVARCAELGERIASEEARLVREGAALARAGNPAARGPLLAALALNPSSFAAFEALLSAPAAGRSLRHTVGPRDTAVSLADLYYGDRKRAELIEQANGLAPGAPLTPGQMLRIPEIPGVPFLRPDR